MTEEDKYRYVSRCWLICITSFSIFKAGEHYWLDYVGHDKYCVLSDNALKQTSFITTEQLKNNFKKGEQW